MRHADWLERMLEADPAELAGEGDTPLAIHIRSCDLCRILARRMLREQARMARALEAVRPATAPEEAIDRVLAGESRETGRFRPVLVLAPLAVAAAVAALLLWMPGGEDPTRTGVPSAPSDPAPRVSVDVPPGGAIVFATRDPDVTVVWLEPPEGEPR